jgi:hypothetical protein
MRKRVLPSLLILIFVLACVAISQLQPGLLQKLGAVDGTFGIRPMSHQCLGFRLNGASIGWLPAADFRFTLGSFAVRYWVDEEPWPERAYCIGQDVWFGE